MTFDLDYGVICVNTIDRTHSSWNVIVIVTVVSHRRQLNSHVNMQINLLNCFNRQLIICCFLSYFHFIEGKRVTKKEMRWKKNIISLLKWNARVFNVGLLNDCIFTNTKRQTAHKILHFFKIRCKMMRENERTSDDRVNNVSMYVQ